jgi:hypothetical protein
MANRAGRAHGARRASRAHGTNDALNDGGHFNDSGDFNHRGVFLDRAGHETCARAGHRRSGRSSDLNSGPGLIARFIVITAGHQTSPGWLSRKAHPTEGKNNFLVQNVTSATHPRQPSDTLIQVSEIKNNFSMIAPMGKAVADVKPAFTVQDITAFLSSTHV